MQTLPAPPASPVPVASYDYDAQGNLTRTVQAPGVAGCGFATLAGYDMTTGWGTPNAAAYISGLAGH